MTQSTAPEAPSQAPLVLARETVKLAYNSWMRVTAVQSRRGHVTLELHIVRPGSPDVRVTLLPNRSRAVARAFDRLAGQLGVRP